MASLLSILKNIIYLNRIHVEKQEIVTALTSPWYTTWTGITSFAYIQNMGKRNLKCLPAFSAKKNRLSLKSVLDTV